MAQIVNNSEGYDAGSAGSGPGAVIFGPPNELFKADDEWNKQNAQDAKDADAADKQRTLDSRALIADLDPNTKGALETDMPLLNKDVADLQQETAQVFKKYQNNPTSPEALLAQQNLHAKKIAIEGRANESTQYKTLLLNADKNINGDQKDLLNHDATAINMAKLRSLNQEDRPAFLKSLGGRLEVDAPINLSTELSKGLGTPSGLQPDVTYQTITDPITGKQTGVQTNSTYSPQKLEYDALAKLQDPKAQKGMQQEFAALQPWEQKAWTDRANEITAQAKANNKPEDVRTPEQLFAIDKHIKEHSLSKTSFKAAPRAGQTPEENYYWFTKKQDYKAAHPTATDDDYNYDYGLSAVNGDAERGFSHKTVNTVTGETTYSGSNLEGQKATEATVDVDNGMGGTKPVPNMVLAVQPIKDNNGNIIGSKQVTTADLIKNGINNENVNQTPKEQLYADMDKYGATQVTRGTLDDMKQANKWKMNTSGYISRTPQNRQVVTTVSPTTVSTGMTLPNGAPMPSISTNGATAAPAQTAKPKVVKEKYQDKTAKKTKFVYSDGTSEIVDGLK